MADITTPHILSKPERQTVSTFLNYRPRQTRSSRFSVFLRTSTGSFDGEKKKEIDERGRVCHVNEHFHRKRRFFVIRIEGVTRDGHSFRMSTKSNSVARIFRGDFYRPISTRGTSRKRNMVIRPTTVDAILAPSARSTLFMSG